MLYRTGVFYINAGAVLCISRSDVISIENHHNPQDLFSLNKHILFYCFSWIYFMLFLRLNESLKNTYSQFKLYLL